MGWNESTAQSTFPIGAALGTVHSKPDTPPQIEIPLAAGGPSLQISLGNLEYTDPRGHHQYVSPRTSGKSAPYVQPPALVVPISLDTSVGLQLSLRCLLNATGTGLDLELRLQTIETIDSVALEVTLAAPEGVSLEAIDFPPESPAAATSAPKRRPIVHQTQAAGSSPEGLLITADVGETGRLHAAGGPGDPENHSSQGGPLCYNFFRQSLEKGVILVGRLGLHLLDGCATPAAFAETWMAEHPYL